MRAFIFHTLLTNLVSWFRGKFIFPNPVFVEHLYNPVCRAHGEALPVGGPAERCHLYYPITGLCNRLQMLQLHCDSGRMNAPESCDNSYKHPAAEKTTRSNEEILISARGIFWTKTILRKWKTDKMPFSCDEYFRFHLNIRCCQSLATMPLTLLN